MNRTLPDWHRLTRRDLLKWAGFGFLGLAAVPFTSSKTQGQPDLVYGRLVNPTSDLYISPSFRADIIRTYWQDKVLPITDVLLGDGEPQHNRIWYNLNGEGYVHSGEVQPVYIRTNPPSNDVPPGGRLAEVTVPFTDATWWPNSVNVVAYRLYYGTTHWVQSWELDSNGSLWYKLADDKVKTSYYAQASHLRLIPYEELRPISPEVPITAKRIEVRRSAQVVIAYEYERPVLMARTATGAIFSNGDYTTPAGRHYTTYKRPSRHMAAGDRAAANSYDLPGIPWVCYITEDGVAFHGTYWHNDYGKQRSHGCINLTPQAARWVYLWTLPHVDPLKDGDYDESATAVDVT